jgi:hypothetical protein
MKRLLTLVIIGSSMLASVGCVAQRHCNHCAGPLGCRPCNMGWQRGGTDYQRFFGNNHHAGCGQAGCMGGHHALAHSQPSGAGPATGGPMAQVAYPYYTTRGPRDFFLDNPPTIGR